MAKNVKINGVTYDDVPEVAIPLADGSGDAAFYDTADDTAQPSQILNGVTVHGANGAITGTMVNHGSEGKTVTNLSDISIEEGYYDGTGKIKIDDTEKAKIISSNIVSGVSILGVSGDTNNINTLDATATPNQVINGATCYVKGQKVTGTLTTPTVSQDSVTKILSIS